MQTQICLSWKPTCINPLGLPSILGQTQKGFLRTMRSLWYSRLAALCTWSSLMIWKTLCCPLLSILQVAGQDSGNMSGVSCPQKGLWGHPYFALDHEPSFWSASESLMGNFLNRFMPTIFYVYRYIEWTNQSCTYAQSLDLPLFEVEAHNLHLTYKVIPQEESCFLY